MIPYNRKHWLYIRLSLIAVSMMSPERDFRPRPHLSLTSVWRDVSVSLYVSFLCRFSDSWCSTMVAFVCLCDVCEFHPRHVDQPERRDPAPQTSSGIISDPNILPDPISLCALTQRQQNANFTTVFSPDRSLNSANGSHRLAKCGSMYQPSAWAGSVHVPQVPHLKNCRVCTEQSHDPRRKSTTEHPGVRGIQVRWREWSTVSPAHASFLTGLNLYQGCNLSLKLPKSENKWSYIVKHVIIRLIVLSDSAFWLVRGCWLIFLHWCAHYDMLFP